ncbi:beta-galactosidase [Lewinella sp. IMCC34191]|uniref:beta-galactosidase n=1 Tax=Lewinella sp. IMCC34191 TaxID=2259172 RepID=UPI0018E53C97|nr:beta-galactosidase [Lewinella sp. IMCC34191]
MRHWLDAPAGKHGFLTAEGKDYVFEDGTPVKFWGVNVANHRVFPEPEEAAEWVESLSRYGINAVRFHKFTWEATDGERSTELTSDHWRRLDGFSNQLRTAGIYYGWSHIYGHPVAAADSAGMVAYQEVRDLNYPWAHLNGSTSGLVNFAEDLQVLNIALTVNMLEHRNPVTGLRYADDPALAFVELQNEDDIFWSAILRALEQAPSYRKLLCAKFSDWLREKYGSADALEAAWGGQGIADGNSLESNTIFPNPDHGWFSGHYRRATAEGRPVPPHVSDRARFLFEEQLAYYRRAVAAIRKTGYLGVIIGSCWQAGSGITHYYNLYADYDTGPIDRHNYWGAGGGHRLHAGEFDNRSMLAEPGSGLLSTGLQQVADRPFQFSEWMALIPNEWTAEAAPLIAAYGMGLQGWDASFAFAMDFPRLTEGVDARGGIYNVSGPTHLPLYPALVAMIHRGDVTEAEVVSRRTISLQALDEGVLPFRETVVQDYDRKSISGLVDPSALLEGRVVVSFADSTGVYGERRFDRSADTIRSRTGQLTWRRSPGDGGSVTINTSGTQGVVGCYPAEEITLDDVTLRTDNPFSVVLVTSLDSVRGIRTAKRSLVTTIARARNRGMTYRQDSSILTNTGSPPALLEPVVVRLKLWRRGATVHVLHQDGRRTGTTIPEIDGAFLLDGRRHRTFYYEIVYGSTSDPESD